MGKWLDVNGEGIYGTSPWLIAGEGPTNLGEATDIGFNEADTVYTKEDIRFTVKGDTLYATFLAWPGEEAIIHTLRGEGGEDDDDEDEDEEDWDDEDEEDWDDDEDDEDDEDWDDDEDVPSLAGKTFTIERPDAEYTWVFKEEGRVTVSGGMAGEGADGIYEQEGHEVYIRIGNFEIEGTFDGEEFDLPEREEAPRYPGFYPQEIKRITMLGDGRTLDWEMTREGLIIETPDRKPCKHAYVFKIERYHHPRID